MLDKLLETMGMSSRAYAKLVKVSPAFVHLAQTGAKPVPAKRIVAWADALELVGKEREAFLDEAWLSHCPPHVVELVRRLKARR